MALAGGESTSSASVAEEQTDPVEPCLPSQGRERAQKGQAEDAKAVSRASLVEVSGTISRL
jgi:hypothetical protein